MKKESWERNDLKAKEETDMEKRDVGIVSNDA